MLTMTTMTIRTFVLLILLAVSNAFSVLPGARLASTTSPRLFSSMPPLKDNHGGHGDPNAHHHPGQLDGIDKDLQNIINQSEVYREQKLAEDPKFFDKLGSGHAPAYMWIGCADARVPANEIMGEDAGSVFVVRNVANMVVNTDFNLMSALQYAVAVLQVPHIIVCGHYDCGGVRASMEKTDHVPPLENWLRNIRDVYRLHREELDAIPDPECRHRRLVELNVIEQCLNLFKTGAIQRKRVATYMADQVYTTPRIHAMVFEPKTGRLIPLRVNFSDYIKDLRGVYDLYHVQGEKKKRKKPLAAPPPVIQPSFGQPASVEKPYSGAPDFSQY